MNRVKLYESDFHTITRTSYYFGNQNKTDWVDFLIEGEQRRIHIGVLVHPDGRSLCGIGITTVFTMSHMYKDLIEWK